MFKSQLSGKQYEASIAPVKVVVERREQTYINEAGLISHGWEIVREIMIGPDESYETRPQPEWMMD